MIRLFIVIGLVVGIFYFTSAGSKIMEGLSQIEPACNKAGEYVNPAMVGRVCGAIGNGVRYIDRATSQGGAAGEQFKNLAQQHLSGLLNYGHSATLDKYSGVAQNDGPITQVTNALSSSAQALQEKINQGPVVANNSGTNSMQRALDDFAIGHKFMGEGKTTDAALPWLQQGAATPGYGVMSQLTLGDIYRSGNNGVPADPQASSNYYTAALQSIELLEKDGSAEARKILQSLGGSTTQVKQQLQTTIATLKAKK